MKLKISQDAEASAAQVHAALTDFARIEAMLRDRGVEIARVGRWTDAGVGREWSGRAHIRGKVRRIEARIDRIEPDRGLTIAARIGGLRLEHDMVLVPLGDAVTRVNATTDLRPDTLSARLLVQSLKLARNRVLGRMQRRLASEISRIESLAAESA